MAITKPPWVWEKVTGEGKVTESSLRGPETVLCRYWYDNPPAQDARLIAAAPELYEACKEMMIRLADIFNRFERPTYYVGRNADSDLELILRSGKLAIQKVDEV